MNDNSNKKKEVKHFLLRKWKGFKGDMKTLCRITKTKSNTQAITSIIQNSIKEN